MGEMIEVYFRTCRACGSKVGVLKDRAIQIDAGEMKLICVDDGHEVMQDEEDLPLDQL